MTIRVNASLMTFVSIRVRVEIENFYKKTVFDNPSLATSVLRNKLHSNNIHLKNADVVSLLEGETASNNQVSFEAGCDALAIFASPKSN